MNIRIRSILIIYFSFFHAHILHTSAIRRAVIIIHGTFASGSQWYRKGGDFFKAISHSFKDHTVESFNWSGKTTRDERLQAGEILNEFIKLKYNPEDEISIIGHSHGVNVGIVASQLLEKHSIKRFYALAPPVSAFDYMPNMERIKKFHNLFSYGDRIQPVLNSFKRVYPDHPRITNTQITINTLCPEHSSLHHPVVGNYLPELDDLLFPNKDCVLHLHTKKKPYVAIDATREKDLEIDRRHLEKLVGGFVFLRASSPHNYLQR
jgi:esterase/lipase